MNKKKNRQIIAIGGGGFGRDPNHRKIEQYIIDQAHNDNPSVLFLPTASAEDKIYIDNYYECFGALPCKPTHISFFSRTPRLNGLLNKTDIIYVGGGNTKSMLAVWREWKVDILLRRAYERGVVMAGVSAGAICWFTQGITDSWASNLNVLDCLGFISGNNCPHYDGEKNRKPSVLKFLKENKISSCFAIEDGAALHYKNHKLETALSFYESKNAYHVVKDGEQIIENKIKVKKLY